MLKRNQSTLRYEKNQEREQREGQQQVQVYGQQQQHYHHVHQQGERDLFGTRQKKTIPSCIDLTNDDDNDNESKNDSLKSVLAISYRENNNPFTSSTRNNQGNEVKLKTLPFVELHTKNTLHPDILVIDSSQCQHCSENPCICEYMTHSITVEVEEKEIEDKSEIRVREQEVMLDGKQDPNKGNLSPLVNKSDPELGMMLLRTEDSNNIYSCDSTSSSATVKSISVATGIREDFNMEDRNPINSSELFTSCNPINENVITSLEEKNVLLTELLPINQSESSVTNLVTSKIPQEKEEISTLCLTSEKPKEISLSFVVSHHTEISSFIKLDHTNSFSSNSSLLSIINHPRENSSNAPLSDALSSISATSSFSSPPAMTFTKSSTNRARKSTSFPPLEISLPSKSNSLVSGKHKRSSAINSFTTTNTEITEVSPLSDDSTVSSDPSPSPVRYKKRQTLVPNTKPELVQNISPTTNHQSNAISNQSILQLSPHMSSLTSCISSTEMNSLSSLPPILEAGSYPFRWENTEDNSSPLNFKYSTVHIKSRSFAPLPLIEIPSADCCHCVNGICDPSNCACAKFSRYRLTKKNKLDLLYYGQESNAHKGNMLTECWSGCSCENIAPSVCYNRYIQMNDVNPTLDLLLCKTKDRGWALYTRKAISKSTYISSYIGEIISESIADEREGQDQAYLWTPNKTEITDAEIADDPYTIDARWFGNISRFVNHSHRPNLRSIQVIREHRSPLIPHIAFFSEQRIEPNTELTINYQYPLEHQFFVCRCEECKEKER